MKQLDDPRVINLKRTQYAIRNKQNRWQRIAARFTEVAALAAIAATVASVVISYLEPALFPLPA